MSWLHLSVSNLWVENKICSNFNFFFHFLMYFDNFQNLRYNIHIELFKVFLKKYHQLSDVKVINLRTVKENLSLYMIN